MYHGNFDSQSPMFLRMELKINPISLKNEVVQRVLKGFKSFFISFQIDTGDTIDNCQTEVHVSGPSQEKCDLAKAKVEEALGYRLFLSRSRHYFNYVISHTDTRRVLIGVEYRNCRRTLDVYLLFAIWMAQIQSKLIYIFVTYGLASL